MSPFSFVLCRTVPVFSFFIPALYPLLSDIYVLMYSFDYIFGSVFCLVALDFDLCQYPDYICLPGDWYCVNKSFFIFLTALVCNRVCASEL